MLLFTHKKDDVDNDENIFDKVYAATIRVAGLWFLVFNQFLWFFLAGRAAAACTVVVVNACIVVVMTGRAILCWFIWCHCTSFFLILDYFFFYSQNRFHSHCGQEKRDSQHFLFRYQSLFFSFLSNYKLQ